jgi:Protein of unknown function (DUF4242)
MPLFMDIHHPVEGAMVRGVADASRTDLAIQADFAVRYLRHWFSPASGRVFCLVKAPSADAADAVHCAAHGRAAEENVKVIEGIEP